MNFMGYAPKVRKMKLIIDIPKEFEEHFNNDRFQESFKRILSDINSDKFLLTGLYEEELIRMLIEAINKAEQFVKEV